VKSQKPHQPGSDMIFNLEGVNDYSVPVSGNIKMYLIDSAGKKVEAQSDSITIPPFLTKTLPTSIKLPVQKGGYLLVAEFTPDNGKNNPPLISRRYIKVGDCKTYNFFELKPTGL